MAESIKEQQIRTLLSAVERVAEKVGNVVQAGGRPFTFDTWLEALDRIHMEFDDSGNPQFPTFLLSPEMFLHMREQISAWETNDDYARRLAELVARKRLEWNARESNRKLVD